MDGPWPKPNLPVPDPEWIPRERPVMKRHISSQPLLMSAEGWRVTEEQFRALTTEEHFAQVTETVEERALRDLEVLRQYAELRRLRRANS